MLWQVVPQVALCDSQEGSGRGRERAEVGVARSWEQAGGYLRWAGGTSHLPVLGIFAALLCRWTPVVSHSWGGNAEPIPVSQPGLALQFVETLTL